MTSINLLIYFSNEHAPFDEHGTRKSSALRFLELFPGQVMNSVLPVLNSLTPVIDPIRLVSLFPA
jgi:hypothetical protein